MRNNTPKVGKPNHKLKAQRAVKQRKVTFSLFAPEAQEVLVAGDFSHWMEEPVSLKKHKGGIWQATLHLTPGVYEYKLVVDGEWRDDPSCEVRVSNAFGTENGLRVVE
jgi:1,4-alpha-glucan branching enzyme